MLPYMLLYMLPYIYATVYAVIYAVLEHICNANHSSAISKYSKIASQLLSTFLHINKYQNCCFY